MRPRCSDGRVDDPAPGHPWRDPGRPFEARASEAAGRPRGSNRSTWSSGTSTRSVRPLDGADRHRRAHDGAGRGQEPRARGQSWSILTTTTWCWPSCASTACCRPDSAASCSGCASPTPRVRRGDRVVARRGSRGPPPSLPRWRPSGPRSSATARTPTNWAPATDSSTTRGGGRRAVSTAGRRCPTSTSTTPTRPGGWCTRLGDRPAAVVIKHANPCGVAVADDMADAYERAHACDPVSAFGGIVAVNRAVPVAMAEALAPASSPRWSSHRDTSRSARGAAGKKKNLRVLEAAPPAGAGPGVRQHRRRSAGADHGYGDDRPATRGPVVTERATPTEAEWRDLELAWRVVARVKSQHDRAGARTARPWASVLVSRTGATPARSPADEGRRAGGRGSCAPPMRSSRSATASTPPPRPAPPR